MNNFDNNIDIYGLYAVVMLTVCGVVGAFVQVL